MIDYENNIEEVQIGLLKVKVADITIDDMPTDTMRDIYEICGRDAAIKILIYMAGNTFQIPVRPWFSFQERYILEHYDYTAKCINKLTSLLCVSPFFVREVLKKNRVQKIIPTEGQRSIFDGIEDAKTKTQEVSNE